MTMIPNTIGGAALALLGVFVVAIVASIGWHVGDVLIAAF